VTFQKFTGGGTGDCRQAVPGIPGVGGGVGRIGLGEAIAGD